MDIDTGEVIALEALVRWRHPERGLVAPMEFIPLAEETGLIIGLGEWVLRQRLSRGREVARRGHGSPSTSRPCSSATTIWRRSSRRILTETGLAPNRLEIEVTESLLLRDAEANLTTLNELKALGVRISMDDFGTGYSSLGNLRSFPFDKIKIDRSFVSDLENNADSAAIVRAVLGLGRSLGMATCAEGVETSEQLVCLAARAAPRCRGIITRARSLLRTFLNCCAYTPRPRPIGCCRKELGPPAGELASLPPLGGPP